MKRKIMNGSGEKRREERENEGTDATNRHTGHNTHTHTIHSIRYTQWGIVVLNEAETETENEIKT